MAAGLKFVQPSQRGDHSLADLIAGYRVPFEPRWQSLPEGFWQFLAVGAGGYIGGRSLEKVASAATPPKRAGFPFMRGSDRKG